MVKTKEIENSDPEYLLILKFKRDTMDHSFWLDQKRHEMKMKELEFSRENDRLHHEREMERQRIKTAEIRKDREWKANERYASNYYG